MNRDMEARLRAALDAAADTVTPATLRPLVAPRPSARVRRPRVPRPALVAAAAAVTVGAVTGGTMIVQSSLRPGPAAPANDTALVARMASTRGDIAVFLCHRGTPPFIPACRSGDSPGSVSREATKAEIKAVERMLKARPDVASVTFEDRRTAFDNFKQMYRDNAALIAATRVDDMPESFRVTLTEGADPRPVIEAARGMPGVADVVDQQCVNRLNERADQAKRTGGTPPTMPC